jgi:hypothetical protein
MLESEKHSLSCRLSGGGCSLPRTRLWDKIPVNREKYREFHASEWPERFKTQAQSGFAGLTAEIVTGSEQGITG